MTQNKKIKIIFFSLLTLAFLVLLAIYVSFWPEIPEKKARLEHKFLPPPAQSENSPPVSDQAKAGPETKPEPASSPLPTVRMSINGVAYDVPQKSPGSVYGAMETLRKNGKITFTEKTYSGIGKLITSINGIKSNGDMTWIYYVNEKEAEIGVSKNIIKPGDVVSWKYEKVTY